MQVNFITYTFLNLLSFLRTLKEKKKKNSNRYEFDSIFFIQLENQHCNSKSGKQI